MRSEPKGCSGGITDAVISNHTPGDSAEPVWRTEDCQQFDANTRRSAYGFGQGGIKDQRIAQFTHPNQDIIQNYSPISIYTHSKIVDNPLPMLFLGHRNPMEDALERESDYGLTQMVQQRLMDLIFAGDFVSGDKVTEISVAERLGVSRGPVREAFRALEEGGLLVTERNRGVFVRKISPEEAVEIQEVRSALDEMAARRAASILTAQQIKDLQGLIADMDVAADKDMVKLFYTLNLKFHEQLVRWSGNAKLLATYQRLIMELHLYRQKGLEPAGEMHHSNVAHKSILQQIALSNPDGAAKAMREHTAHGRQRILLGQNEVSNAPSFTPCLTPTK